MKRMTAPLRQSRKWPYIAPGGLGDDKRELYGHRRVYRTVQGGTRTTIIGCESEQTLESRTGHLYDHERDMFWYCNDAESYSV